MNDLDFDVRMAANEAVLSRDVDEAEEHIRAIANKFAQQTNQRAAQLQATNRAFNAWMAENHEDLLSDPELMKLVMAREQFLMRVSPGMNDQTRWHRASNDVRRIHGDANARVIRGMRQARVGARYSSDGSNYKFDTGAEDGPDEGVMEVEDAEIQADRTQAIQQIQLSRFGREVPAVDKARYNDMELRRRQRGGT